MRVKKIFKKNEVIVYKIRKVNLGLICLLEGTDG